MPNKSKKTSNVLIVSAAKNKNKRGAKKQVTAPRGLTPGQHLIKGVTSTGLAYAKSGLIGAAITGAGHLYEYLGDASASPRMTTIAAPVSQIPTIAGTFTDSFKVKSLGPDTISVSGSLMTMRVNISASGIAAYDNVGNFHYVTEQNNGAFQICMRATSNFGQANVYQSGFPNFFCPLNSPLTSFATMYGRWRPEGMAFRWVPSCPTSTQGSIMMAWSPDAHGSTVDAAGGIDIYGPTPYTFAIMSQQVAFTSNPVWQSNVMGVNPRKHGICENPKDWLGTTYFSSAAANGFATQSNTGNYQNAGFLHFNVASPTYPGIGSAYDLGYIVFDYEYTLHNKGPLRIPFQTYSLTSPDFLDSPLNKDIVEELKRRYESKVAPHKGRLTSILYDLGHTEIARKICQKEQKRVSIPQRSGLDQECEEKLCEELHEDIEMVSFPQKPRSGTPVPPCSAVALKR